MFVVLGISGKAGSGKDSSADFMRGVFSYYHIVCHKISFATKLKDIAAQMFCLTERQMSILEEKEKPLPQFNNITPRMILQKLGTDVARELYQDIWVYHLHKELLDLYVEGLDTVVFVPDMRFKNEYDYIRSFYNYDARNFRSLVMSVERPGFSINNSGHRSENGLNGVKCWDYSIKTDDFVRLKIEAVRIAREIHEKYFVLNI